MTLVATTTEPHLFDKEPARDDTQPEAVNGQKQDKGENIQSGHAHDRLQTTADGPRIRCIQMDAVERRCLGDRSCVKKGTSGLVRRVAIHAGQHGATDPALRGQGLAREVLHALMNASKQRGDRAIVLHAQTSATGFYRKEGFEPVGPEFEEAGIAHQEMEIRWP